MQSHLYVGRVKHRRQNPAQHQFAYRLFMVYLDLDELPHIFQRYWLWSATRPNVARFKRSDHLGDPRTSLSDAVRDLVTEHTGQRPEGPIRLLTQLRYFGYGFNPVSFYYCFDGAGERVETIVAEVNNTPWGEQHCYVLNADQDLGRHGHMRFQMHKAFHVSPFMPMEIDYDWRFSEPNEDLSVHMENYTGVGKIFDATLTLRRRPMSRAHLASVLIQYPLITVKVIGAIYFQALRLWLKRVPFYNHPKHLDPSSSPKELCRESHSHK
jgi:DUF1365 family protein